MIIQHKKLMPDIWEHDFTLREAARASILKYIYKYLDYMEEVFHIELDYDKDIKDIVLVGTCTNYLYTRRSDIDIHIVADVSKILSKCSPDVVNEIMPYLTKNFLDFYNPRIGRREIDIAIFNTHYLKEFSINASDDGLVPDFDTYSSAYSVLRNEWIRRPVILAKSEIRELNKEVLQIYSEMKIAADYIFKNKLPPSNAQSLLLRFKQDRAEERFGRNQHKDFGPYNIAFRIARKKGLLKKLAFYIKKQARPS